MVKTYTEEELSEFLELRKNAVELRRSFVVMNYLHEETEKILFQMNYSVINIYGGKFKILWNN